jgi:5'-deoxynucleotidase YfbR-like HD superfamily hydrolase
MTEPKSERNTEKIVTDILQTIEREREREIVSRRFGLFDRKETLEQIGELLGITRERVRQLEKAVVIRLKMQAEEGNVPHVQDLQKELVDHLQTTTKVARIKDLTQQFVEKTSRIEHARVAFIASLCADLVVVDENDTYYQVAGLKSEHDEKQLKAKVNQVLTAVKDIGKPTTIAEIAKQAKIANEKHVEGLARASKHIATLNGRWGLIKWPMVNPKNIRDKIYVILYENGKHMHFNEIAKAIQESGFKRNDVTVQAIHNELIKDKRFVLVGRGIYALKEWGFKKGTVADTITDVLKKAGQPLHRDDIVREVLKSRYVKETTILLNLQGKPQFKRVAKATYTVAE